MKEFEPQGRDLSPGSPWQPRQFPFPPHSNLQLPQPPQLLNMQEDKC